MYDKELRVAVALEVLGWAHDPERGWVNPEGKAVSSLPDCFTGNGMLEVIGHMTRMEGYWWRFHYTEDAGGTYALFETHTEKYGRVRGDAASVHGPTAVARAALAAVRGAKGV